MCSLLGLILGSILILSPFVVSQETTLVAQVAVPFPAFLSYDESTDTILATSFTVLPGKTGNIFAIHNVSVTHPSKWNPELLVIGMNWPNEVNVDQPLDLLCAEGFLVPGHETGGISRFQVNQEGQYVGPVVDIGDGKKDFFYHRTRYVDVNQDGIMDILSARAIHHLITQEAYGELVWFPGPDFDKEYVITGLNKNDSPDVFFELARGLVRNDGNDEDPNGLPDLVGALFFKEKLMLYPGSSQWKDPVVIDDSIGALFDVSVVDLDCDGEDELLVTNHVDNETLSGVFVYKYKRSADGSSDGWDRKKIAGGFKVLEKGQGQAAPGRATAYYPRSDAKCPQLPSIVVGGDGSQMAYILTPNVKQRAENRNRNSPSSLFSIEYDMEVLVDAKATVGPPIVSDFDGDGINEIIVPAYDSSILYVYKCQ